MARTTKIVIHVEGGVVQGVFTSDPNYVDLSVIDVDNLKEEGLSASDIEDLTKSAINNLTEIY